MVFYGRVSKRAVFSVKLAIDLWVDLEAENKVCGVTSRLLRLGHGDGKNYFTSDRINTGICAFRSCQGF